MKRIGFIGAGKAGTALGLYFSRKGYPVTGYLSRTRDHAKTSAELVGASVYDDYKDIARESDILFLTVPDAKIQEVAEELVKSCSDLHGKWIVHCSGALSSSVFPDLKGACGFSLHPAMALSEPKKAAENFPSAVFTIECAPDGAKDFFTEAGLHVVEIETSKKTLYHLACAVSSNFVTGLYSWALEILKTAGISENDAISIITPLFKANAASVTENGPVDALTGPVERADSDTVRHHLDALTSEDDKTLYRLLSEKLIFLAKEKNPDRSYSKLEDTLWH